MSDELATWLREVLDEDESRANDSIGVFEGGPAGETVWRWMLADIAAKRAILNLAVKVLAARDERDDRGVFISVPIARARMRDVVRLLASAYADRPGYQEAWRP